MSKRKYLTTTSAMIMLILFDAKAVIAESVDIGTDNEATITNVQTKEDFKNATIRNSAELESESKLIENLLIHLDEEQEAFLKELMSDEEKQILFKEAISEHEKSNFDSAVANYEILIDKMHIEQDNDEDVINILKELAMNESLIVDYINEQTAVDEDINQANEELADVQENEPTEDVNSESSQEENNEASNPEESDLQEEKEDASRSPQLMSIANVKTVNHYYSEIKASNSVSERWKLALEMKNKFGSDAIVAEAINFAASSNYNYARRAHDAGNYAVAVSYYNRIINEPLVAEGTRTKAAIYQQQANRAVLYGTVEQYYSMIRQSNSVSERWKLALEMKDLFGADALVVEAINLAANSNFDYARRAHNAGNYAVAISYYNRVINEPLVDESIRSQATIYQKQADRVLLYNTAEDYYEAIRQSKSISERWTLALESKELFHSGTYVTASLNFAAKSNIDYARRQHQSRNYNAAINYYNRVINEPLVDQTIRNQAAAHKKQAESQSTYRTAADYYQDIRTSNSISQRWTLALELKELFQTGTEVADSLNFAAKSNIDYARRQHQSGNYNAAINYYNRVINEPLVDQAIRDQAVVHKNQAESRSAFRTAADYYQDIRTSNSISQRWTLALELKDLFQTGTEVTASLNFAAKSNIDYARRQHQSGNYSAAINYYTRVINEPLVDQAIRDQAAAHKKQAESRSAYRTAADYYKDIRTSNSISERWTLALEFKKIFNSSEYVNEAIDFAAKSNLDYAMRQHRDKKYSAASSYYIRLMNEPSVSNDIFNKANAYNYLAESNLGLTNFIIRKLDHTITLNDFVTIQMSKKPQISHRNGWIDAQRHEVLSYVNPANSATTSMADMLYTLTIGNTDPLQHLKLSNSIGIPYYELDKMLEGKGILNGMGKAFQEASKNSSTNELYLLSHSILETGHGKSKLATGILVKEVNGVPVTPRVVYNMFGIGAFDRDPNKFGSERAYELGWFTPEAAIIGGAQWISSSYIHNPIYQQDTLYKMRWNVQVPSHQYATDVAWAYKQTYILSNVISLSQKYDLLLNFEVPSYK